MTSLSGPACPPPPDAPAPAIAIGCFGSIGRDWLAERLLIHARHHPDVEVGVHGMPRAGLLPALRDRRIALALVPDDPAADVSSTLLWHDRVLLLMAPSHRLAAQEAISPQALAGERFLVARQQAEADIHRFLLGRVVPAGSVGSSVIVDASSRGIRERVAAGEGLALTHGAGPDAAGGEVVVRAIAGAAALFPVWLCWRGAETGAERALRQALCHPSG